MAVAPLLRPFEHGKHQIGPIDPVGAPVPTGPKHPDQRHAVWRHHASRVVDPPQCWITLAFHNAVHARDADVVAPAGVDPAIDGRESHEHIDGVTPTPRILAR